MLITKTMDFKNAQVDISSLPSVEQLEYETLDQNYLTVELLGMGFVLIFPMLGSILFSLFNEIKWPEWMNFLPFTLLLIILAISVLWITRGFKLKLFALREKDIVYRRGLFWKRITVLPFNRIQHAEVEQGPIERLFQLSQLKIYTAGGSSSDLTIAGLNLQRAEAIKQYILGKTSSDEQE